MEPKQRYIELCKIEPSIPLFSRPWWLDVTCGENCWDVTLVEKNNEIVAAMPYYITRRLGGTVICMPMLTHTMGVWMKYPDKQKYTTMLSFEMEVMDELIDKLPTFSYFYQHFDHTITNWLPFYWRGFEQTTRYTYICENIKNPGLLWDELKSKVRTEIKKAEKSGLTVSEESNIDVLWQLVFKTFERQGVKPKFTREYLKGIYESSRANNAGKILVAYDGNRTPYVGLFYVWDEHTAYFIISGADPELRNTGATTLLYWQGMLDAAKTTERVNFCGSMMKSIELLLRGLGTKQTPYFAITSDRRNSLFREAINIWHLLELVLRPKKQIRPSRD